MDDFRVGSVPSPDPYGSRQPSDAITRRRHHHPGDQSGEQDEPEDTFETADANDEPEPAAEPIEDYYVPSDPDEVEE